MFSVLLAWTSCCNKMLICKSRSRQLRHSFGLSNTCTLCFPWRRFERRSAFRCRKKTYNTHLCSSSQFLIQPCSFLMVTSSNGNIFRVIGPLCGEFTGPGEFPTQRPVPRSFGVFFDLRLNKRFSKQPWGWWFETLSWSLWRQCDAHFDLANICVYRLDVFHSYSIAIPNSHLSLNYANYPTRKTLAVLRPVYMTHPKINGQINTCLRTYWTTGFERFLTPVSNWKHLRF